MCFSARCCVLKLGCLATCWILPGAQLPLRHYSTTDGLASNAVYSIASDSRGFLWFATAEGLSRFDGYGFANQTERTGLPHGRIRKILIGRHGNYWLATDGGLIRFRPDLPQSSRDRMIVIHPSSKRESPNIWTLLEDRAGTLWCGTDDGLYAIEDTASPAPHPTKIPIGQTRAAGNDVHVRGLTEDLEGAVWIGVTDGTLYRRLRDRRIEQYPPTEAGRGAAIYCVHADRTGRIWVGRESGLYRSTTASHPGANGFDSLSGKSDGLPRGRVLQIFESRHGDVWVGMFGLLAQSPAHEEPARVWTKDNGLPSRMAQALGQDRDGNLWLGTDEQGAYKLPTDILSYSAAEIGIDSVLSVDETLGGELYIAGFLNGL